MFLAGIHLGSRNQKMSQKKSQFRLTISLGVIFSVLISHGPARAQNPDRTIDVVRSINAQVEATKSAIETLRRQMGENSGTAYQSPEFSAWSRKFEQRVDAAIRRYERSMRETYTDNGVERGILVRAQAWINEFALMAEANRENAEYLKSLESLTQSNIDVVQKEYSQVLRELLTDVVGTLPSHFTVEKVQSPPVDGCGYFEVDKKGRVKTKTHHSVVDARIITVTDFLGRKIYQSQPICVIQMQYYIQEKRDSYSSGANVYFVSEGAVTKDYGARYDVNSKNRLWSYRYFAADLGLNKNISEYISRSKDDEIWYLSENDHHVQFAEYGLKMWQSQLESHIENELVNGCSNRDCRQRIITSVVHFVQLVGKVINREIDLLPSNSPPNRNAAIRSMSYGSAANASEAIGCYRVEKESYNSPDFACPSFLLHTVPLLAPFFLDGITKSITF
ncbi:MAG: hypothetical protein COT74_00990 [Bdellovibrionales bacterium CG10_big_fil_rev_8_21_14_0_10_45_34]|nr:MAG: hypothetical protein COT74_00990 [Bdellovibrionales bacterium CG10_big_fil_rev_8_21_14_0_10_45_34]